MPVTYGLTNLGQHWVAGRPTLMGGVPAPAEQQHVTPISSHMSGKQFALRRWLKRQAPETQRQLQRHVRNHIGPQFVHTSADVLTWR